MKTCDIFKVWGEYKSSLYSYIKKRIEDDNDAKDILQDVLLKSHQFCSQGKSVLYLKSWLYKVTQNSIADFHNKSNKEVVFKMNVIEASHQHSLIGEASEYIKSLLKLLPEKYSIPLLMSDLEGIDQQIIADRLKLTLTNTKSRIQRGRLKLRERFLECCTVEFDNRGEMVQFEINPQCKELQAEKRRLENIL